jgi:hypothetical protein
MLRPSIWSDGVLFTASYHHPTLVIVASRTAIGFIFFLVDWEKKKKEEKKRERARRAWLASHRLLCRLWSGQLWPLAGVFLIHPIPSHTKLQPDRRSFVLDRSKFLMPGFLSPLGKGKSKKMGERVEKRKKRNVARSKSR